MVRLPTYKQRRYQGDVDLFSSRFSSQSARQDAERDAWKRVY